MPVVTRINSSGTYFIAGQLDEVTFSSATNLSITTGNLLAHSEFQLTGQTQASGYWGNTNITSTAGFLAPDQSTNARKVIETAVSGEHFLEQQITISTATTATYTYSVFCKSAERTYVYLRVVQNAGSYDSSITFNLTTGAPSGINGIISSAFQRPIGSTGWWHCGFTYVMPTSTTMLHRIHVLSAANAGSYLGDGTSGYYVWGAQLVPGSTATSYMPTAARVSGAATGDRLLGNVPFKRRVASNGSNYVATADFDEITYNLTTPVYNGLVSSQNFTGAVLFTGQSTTGTWIYNRVTLTTGQPALDGTNSAVLLTDSNDAGVSNTHDLRQNFQHQINTTYTYSIYAKQGTLPAIDLRMQSGLFSDVIERGVTFNLSSGAATISAGNPQYSFTSQGNGWWRCAMVYTATVATSAVGVQIRPHNGSSSFYAGAGTGTVYVWGAQLDTYTTATTYVATTSTGLKVSYSAMKVSSTGSVYVKDLFDEVTGIVEVGGTSTVLLYYDFSQPISYAGTGTTAYDLSDPVRGRTLSVANTAFTQSSGGAIYLPSGFSLGSTGNIVATTLNTMTVSMWLKITSLTANVQRFLTVGSEAFVLRHDGVSNFGQLHLYTTQGGVTTSLRVNSYLSANVLYNITAVTNGTNLILYANGVQLGSTIAQSGNFASASMSYSISSASESFVGEIYQWVMWNKALSATEIAAHYGATRHKYHPIP